MKQLIVIALAVVSISFSGHAQDQEKRDEYVKEFPDMFYIKPIFTFRNLDLRIEDREGDFGHITYRPTTNKYIGLGFYLFEIGFEVSLQLPSSDTEIERFGETKAFDFQSNVYSRRWAADLAFQDYEGFYVNNPAEHFPSWQAGDSYPQRSDLEVRNFTINAYYIANHDKFSFRSSYIQADRQLKSAGSILLGGTFGTFRFNADSALISETTLPDPSAASQVNSGRFIVFGVLAGYTYNFVVKNFYLNLSLSAGPANIWARSETGGEDFKDTKIRPILGARMGLGYNSEKFFCGASTVTQAASFGIEEFSLNGQTSNIKIFAGFRLRETGFLKNKLF